MPPFDPSQATMLPNSMGRSPSACALVRESGRTRPSSASTSIGGESDSSAHVSTVRPSVDTCPQSPATGRVRLNTAPLRASSRTTWRRAGGVGEIPSRIDQDDQDAAIGGPADLEGYAAERG